jgi:TPP-dependent pyruvate/acetoin dehydrogenase alpha subunit
MMCELFGKATGFNGGKGGSMHIADFSVGMLGANGVVAAGLPIAVGAAHAQKLLKKNATTSRSASLATAPSTAGLFSKR